MPKFHKKLSKRMSCRKKYKIIKKVAEHNRKVKRAKKKNPAKARRRKDPGVPNSLPYKEEILQEAEVRKQRSKELIEQQKASRLQKQMENRTLEDMVEESERKDSEFERSNAEASPTADDRKENAASYKSYFRELKKVVDDADVVLQVLDARDPLGSRCPQIEQLVLSSGKKLVLVLNKIDLIPRANLESWLEYLRRELPTVAFKSSTQSQNDNLSQSKVAAIHINRGLQESSLCVGASFLMKVLGNYCRNQNILTFIKVGVVGFPNVGKSSVINSLKRSRSCAVGATAGVTRNVQEVSLDKHIKILDSPGVVFAKHGSETTLALRNAVKVETLRDVLPPAEAILQRADLTQLCLHYTVPEFRSSGELFGMLARRMGKFKRGGVPNIEEGARRLISDWNRGHIKYYTHPPETDERSLHLDATLVEEMGRAFDISALEERTHLDRVPGMFPSRGVAARTAGPTEASMDQESLHPVDDKEEKMEDAVTVDFKKRKEVKVQPSIGGEIGSEMQQNRAVKKQFKRMKKNKRRMDKAATVLSELSL